jgi:hypothetical protein
MTCIWSCLRKKRKNRIMTFLAQKPACSVNKDVLPLPVIDVCLCQNSDCLNAMFRLWGYNSCNARSEAILHEGMQLRRGERYATNRCKIVIAKIAKAEARFVFCHRGLSAALFFGNLMATCCCSCYYHCKHIGNDAPLFFRPFTWHYAQPRRRAA